MSQFKELKQHFAVWLGRGAIEPLPSMFECVPSTVLKKWSYQFNRPIVIDLSRPRRLANHFKIGADPEFVFAYPGINKRVDARAIGLRAGQAFGADNNGRLAEIRPAPSRCVLEVVASIWVTLQWLAAMFPKTLDSEWNSNAYVFEDGVGGHIHFGRFRETALNEIHALDGLSETLVQAGWFDRDALSRRLGTQYGRKGDARRQLHGWEYRTLPSWLDSPELAFFVLVLGKLSVLNPEFALSCFGDAKNCSSTMVRSKIKHFVSFYKGLDDDAAIAYSALSRGLLPRFVGGDFKTRWGIDKSSRYITDIRPQFIPRTIPPTTKDVTQLAAYLLNGTPLIPEELSPSWTPVVLPEGYSPLIDRCDTYHSPGIGELVTELCVHDGCPLSVGKLDAPDLLVVYGKLLDLLHKDWQRSLHSAAQCISKRPVLIRAEPPGSSDDGRRVIYLGSVYTDPRNRRVTRKLLLSGVFPIWHVQQVRSGVWEEWVKAQTPRKTSHRVQSVSVLVGSQSL